MTEPTGPLWRDRNFATYWSAQSVSQLGDRISELAIPLIAVTMLHSSPTVVGLLTAAVWAPSLVSLFVGAWVDQQPRKQRLLIWADLIRAVAVLTLPVAHWLGAVTLTQLFVVALVAGAGGVLYQTSYQPFFVALVRKDQFVEANSLLSTTRSGSFIVGPPLAGGLIQALTAPVAMLVDGVSFLVSALMIRRVRIDEPKRSEPAQESLLRRARMGVRFLRRHAYLSASLRFATTINFFNLVVTALVVLFASRTLGLSAGMIGLAFGIGAFGGLAGAVLAAPVARRIGVGPTIAVGAVLFSAPAAAIPLAGGPVWAKAGVLALVEVVSAAGVMFLDIQLNALQTAVTPDAMRSRVSGAFATLNYGVRPLGAIAGGVSGELIGIGPTLVIAGVGGALSFLWLLGTPIIATRTIAELEPVEPR